MLNGRHSDHVTNWEVLIGLQVPGTMQTMSILSKLEKKQTNKQSSAQYLSNTSRRCSLTAHKTVPEWCYPSQSFANCLSKNQIKVC